MSTDIDPEITEGEIILKDRFLTQSAPDICHKLGKQVFRLNQPLKKTVATGSDGILQQSI